jgi:6-phosphofructo-2-kinase/fructose-2,6-biphosphatase 2
MAGQVALLDATNTTKERRAWLMEQLRELRVKVIFIEPICNDEAMIDNNIRSVKLGTPDYVRAAAASRNGKRSARTSFTRSR